MGLDTTRVRRHLNDAEVNLVQQTGLPNRGALFISESGFYKLVLKSRKPEARKFQDWVTGEVLPSLRKHGIAMTAPVSQAVASGDMSGAELMARAVLGQAKNGKIFLGSSDEPRPASSPRAPLGSL